MNYSKYYPIDVVNGPGTRVTLFVSGCIHQCRGCYNQSTWDPRAGTEFDEVMMMRIISDLNDTKISRRGLTLTGGDPLLPSNLPAVIALLARVRAQCPGKDIWLWSGYRLDELCDEQRRALDYLDVLVDGKFEQALADPSLRFRGSRNQQIHYLTPLSSRQSQYPT